MTSPTQPPLVVAVHANTEPRMPHPQTVTRKKATVTSVNAATLRAVVQWAAGNSSVDGIPWLDSVTPRVGDVVFVDRVKGSPIIVGRVASRLAPVTQSDVATGDTTSSTSYTSSLASTSGPVVTGVAMVAGETVLVTVSFKGNNAAGAGHAAVMSFAVSGANTQAAQDLDSAENDNSVTATMTRQSTYTAVNDGINTFTAQYKTVASGVSTFANRRLTVVQFR